MNDENWEVKDNWREVVCKPVLKYPLAPREALAILELAGTLLQLGIPFKSIRKALGDLASEEA